MAGDTLSLANMLAWCVCSSPSQGLAKTEVSFPFTSLRLFAEPMGSVSSMEVNIDMLEQMDLMDISDQEALDVFLNSGGEDNPALSPVSGGGDHLAQTPSHSHLLPPAGRQSDPAGP